MVNSSFLFLAENADLARILIVESSGLSPCLEQVRRSILNHRVSEVYQMLQAGFGLFSTRDAPIAARGLVEAVFEAITAWFEEDPDSCRPAAEVARIVAEYNSHAIGCL